MKTDCAIGIGQKGENNHSGGERSFSVMRIFVNAKEAPTLISALEDYLAKHPQSKEAKELLSRIYICLEKQGNTKKKVTD